MNSVSRNVNSSGGAALPFGSYASADELSLACKTKSIDLVQMAVTRNAPPDQETLTWACFSGNPSIVEMVIKAGAKPDQETLTAACATKQFSIIAQVVVLDAKPGPRTLSFARDSGDIRIINLIERVCGVSSLSPANYPSAVTESTTQKITGLTSSSTMPSSINAIEYSKIKPVKEINAKCKIKAIAVLPSGTKFASVGYKKGKINNDYILKIWDLASNKLLEDINLGSAPNLGKPLITFLTDEKVLVSHNEDVKLWDLSISKKSFITKFEGKEGTSTHINAMLVLPDGTLVTGGDGGDINWWNISTGICEGTSSADLAVQFLVHHPSGKLVSVSLVDLKLWDLSDAKCILTVEDLPSLKVIDSGINYGINSVAVLSNGSIIYSNFYQVKIIDHVSGNLIGTFIHPNYDMKGLNNFHCLTVLEDKTIVAFDDKGIVFWNSEGKFIHNVKSNRIKFLTSTPSGVILTSEFGNRKKIKIWKIKS